jgi:beta-phosphoglucomutase-like phosphatase (HAD superfamily)
MLVFEEGGYGPYVVTAEWYLKHKPQPDGYLVRYEDGYERFSPAKAFEEGYTKV